MPVRTKTEDLPDPPSLPEPGQPLDLKPHVEYLREANKALNADLWKVRGHFALLIAAWLVILGGIGYGIYLLVR